MIVSKFGGSSVADRDKIKHAISIIADDSQRKYIIVSAPGKRFANDTKVTKLLEAIPDTYEPNHIQKIIERFEPQFQKTLQETLEERLKIKDEFNRKQAILAFGEYANAFQIAKLSEIEFVDATELLDVSSDNKILASSIGKITKRLKNVQKAIIPGFYGRGENGMIQTLGTGTSDLTGAYIAAALNADIYENFTDSSVFAAHPDIISNPKIISHMTYHELRNLSFGGFSIFEARSMIPLSQKNIPIHIRSTKNYPEQGTFVHNKHKSHSLLTGIAYQKGYTAININTMGIHEEVGIITDIARAFSDYNASFDFVPAGIDDITIVSRNVPKQTIKRLQKKFDSVEVIPNIGCIVVAGEGLRGKRGSAAEIQKELSAVNIRFISQGLDESCIVYGVNENDGEAAVNQLYQVFF